MTALCVSRSRPQQAAQLNVRGRKLLGDDWRRTRCEMYAWIRQLAAQRKRWKNVLRFVLDTFSTVQPLYECAGFHLRCTSLQFGRMPTIIW